MGLEKHFSYSQIFNVFAEVYFNKGELKLADEYAKKGLSNASYYEDTSSMEISTKILSKIQIKRNNFSKYLYYDSLNRIYNSKVQGAEKEMEIKRLEFQFHLKEKNKEISELKNEGFKNISIINQQRILFTILSILFAFSLFLLIKHISALRKKNKLYTILSSQKEEILLKNDELQKLNDLVLSQKEKISIQKSDLEKMNSFKDDMFSIISHDLRGPLNSIGLILYTLKEKLVPQEKLAYFLDEANKEFERTRQLLNNLFSWFDSQRNTYQAAITAINLKDIADDNINLLQPEARKKNIHISSELTHEDLVYAELNAISTVIRNIISNSIKFCYENGEIFIGAEKENETLRIAIKDNGIGMSDEVQNKIFSKERITTKGTNNEKGSGYGLKICQELILKNNGEIQVKSKQNEGTTFTIILPLAI